MPQLSRLDAIEARLNRLEGNTQPNNTAIELVSTALVNTAKELEEYIIEVREYVGKYGNDNSDYLNIRKHRRQTAQGGVDALTALHKQMVKAGL